MKAKLMIAAFVGVAQALLAQVNILTNIPSTLSPGSFDAEIKIQKDPSNTFAKYQMDVSQGISVSAVDIKDGNFSFENQRAKVIWVATPEVSEIVIHLRLNIDASTVSPASISQRFTYLSGDNKKEVEVLPIVLTIGTDQAASAAAPAKITTPAGSSKPVAAPAPKTTAPATSAPAAQPVTTQPAAAAAPATAAASGATTYKVQIGSFGNQQPPKGKFAGVDGVTIENVGGVYKAVVGNCKTKEEALQLKDKLQAQGFPGFLVVYTNGVRAK